MLIYVLTDGFGGGGGHNIFLDRQMFDSTKNSNSVVDHVKTYTDTKQLVSKNSRASRDLLITISINVELLPLL